MRLIDLHPEWIGSGGPYVRNADGSQVPWRPGVGLEFDCPCGCQHRVFVPLENPLDGGPPFDAGRDRPRWNRQGLDFESLTLTPSIQREYPARCWHGRVTNGEVTTC